MGSGVQLRAADYFGAPAGGWAEEASNTQRRRGHIYIYREREVVGER